MPEISRRSILIAAGAAVTVGASSASAVAYDPRASAEGQVKLNATLDGTPAFWSYSGIIYAVPPHSRPVPILAVAGCQANWAARQPDNSFRLAAPLLSYFCNVDTREYLDHFDNPFTGIHNDVKANSFSGRGWAVYPADGSAMHLSGAIGASQSAPQGFKAADEKTGIGRVEWSLTRDSVVLNTDQFFDVKTQPQGEAQTRTADRVKFFDPRVSRLPARFSATTISPWLAWMDMGTTEGHLVWHTSGEKVFSLDDVPAAYRAHAGEQLEILTTRPNFQSA